MKKITFCTLPSLFFLLLLLVCIPFIPEAQAARHAVVLQYQHISDRTPPSKSASEEEFVEHLRYLEQQGYRVWPLEKINNRIQSRQSIPDKTVAITFDHAYISVYRNAIKHLRSRQWPFTVFVAAAPVIKEHPLYMNWQQLREIQKAGGSIGTMGVTGESFAKPLPGEYPDEREKRLRKEIDLNQKALAKYLGVIPKLFAYPDGEADQLAKSVIKSSGLTGFGLQQGPASRYSPAYYQPRFTATGTARNITNLSVKISSLPLPVRKVYTKNSPLQPDNQRPEARVQLYSGSYQLSGLRCQNGDGMPVESRVQKGGKRPEFTLKSKLDESPGLIEYTCTAPHDKSTRFYWFSNTWILPRESGRW